MAGSLTDAEKLDIIRDKMRGGPKRKISEYADSIGSDYDELMDHVEIYLATGEYWNEGPRWDNGVSLPDEFWDWYELATGRVVPADQRDYSIFSCAC